MSSDNEHPIVRFLVFAEKVTLGSMSMRSVRLG